MTQPYLSPPRPTHRAPRRGRTVLIIAVTAAVTALLVAGGIIALAFVGGDERVSSTRYDERTKRACQDARTATEHQTEKKGDEAARSARTYARRSDVRELVDIGVRNDDATPGTVLDDARAMTAAYKISTWCLDHKVGS